MQTVCVCIVCTILEDEDLELSLTQFMARKKARIESESEKVYMDLAFLPPTSNICERFFSASRLILNDYRKSMSPLVFKSIMALKMNRDLWNEKLVEKALSVKPK